MTPNRQPTPYLNYKYYVKPNASVIPLSEQPPLRRIRRPHKRLHFDPTHPPHFPFNDRTLPPRLSGATLR